RQRAARAEHGIEFGAADLLAHGAERGLLQHLVGIAGAEQVQLGIVDAVLHVDLDGDDVLVAGQHRHGVAEGLDPCGLDLEHTLHRPRPLQVRPRLHDPRDLAEAQDHATLLLGDQHEAVEHQPQDQQQAGPARDARAAAVAAAEHAAQRLEQPVQGGRVAALAWGAAVVAGPAGNVPGHLYSRESGRFYPAAPWGSTAAASASKACRG